MRAGRSPESRLAALEQWFSRLQSWATTPSGGPAPGTPAYNPAWYALTTVWFDPSNVSGVASDSNSGASALAPLRTWQEIQRRYGSSSPQFNNSQSVQYIQMSGEPLTTNDPIFFEPKLTNGGQAILDVVPTAFGAVATITVNTAKARGAPGTLLTLTLASCPVGVAAGMLAVNSTRSSQAIVDSVGATVVMQQPLTTASLLSTAVLPAPVEDDTWTTGDSVQFYVLSRCNLKRWCPVGGDLAAAQPSGGWVFEASITDTSAAGNSEYSHRCKAACNVLVNCLGASRWEVSSEAGRSQSAYVIGSSCTSGGGPVFTQGICQWYGGGAAGGILVEATGWSIDGDAILHNGNSFQANGKLGNVYGDGTFTCQGAQIQAGGFVWGSYAPTVNPGSVYYNVTGSTFVLKALLTSGAIHLGNITTGSSYAGSGVFADGVALTAANIDAGGAGGPGLCNPVTGAAYCDAH